MAQRKAWRTIDDGIREWFAEHPGMVACAADLVSAGVWPSEASVLARLYAMSAAGSLRRVRKHAERTAFALATTVVPSVKARADARQKRVLALHTKGWTQQQIAEEVGVSQSGVSQILRKAGRTRELRKAQRASAQQQAVEMVLLLHDHGMPPDVIAAQTGCDKLIVCDILRVNGRSSATPRRDALIAEVFKHAKAAGVTPELAWQRLRYIDAEQLPQSAEQPDDKPVPKSDDPLLTRLHLREIWREAMVVPAKAVGRSAEWHRIRRGEGAPAGE